MSWTLSLSKAKEMNRREKPASRSMVELGYTPQLRYREWQQADGQRELRLYALLRYEQHDFNCPVDRDYLSDALEAL